jgi:hypothetical protein
MNDFTDELGALRAAYGNCINDLARTKTQLKLAEDTLFRLSQILFETAHTIQHTRHDNPGTGGSGGD